jgi:hypothetical protein
MVPDLQGLVRAAGPRQQRGHVDYLMATCALAAEREQRDTSENGCNQARDNQMRGCGEIGIETTRLFEFGNRAISWRAGGRAAGCERLAGEGGGGRGLDAVGERERFRDVRRGHVRRRLGRQLLVRGGRHVRWVLGGRRGQRRDLSPAPRRKYPRMVEQSFFLNTIFLQTLRATPSFLDNHRRRRPQPLVSPSQSACRSRFSM